MKPIVDSFVKDWPQAHLAHVLDDSLPDELARAGRITEGLIERFRTLGRYCVAAGADAILFTCATFGTAIDAVKRDHRIPVLKPNESLAQELGTHPGRVALLGTFADSLPSMMAEVEEYVPSAGARPRIELHVVEGAFEALRRNLPDEHNRLIAAAAARFMDCDVIAFSQFSMTVAADITRSTVARPVLTTPHACVRKLKALFSDSPGAHPWT